MPALAANELDTLRVSAAASVKVPASVLAKSAVLKEPAVVTVPVLATESVASVEPASATDCEPEPSSTTVPLEVMTPVPREMLPATLSRFPAIASVPAVSVRAPDRSMGPLALKVPELSVKLPIPVPFRLTTPLVTRFPVTAAVTVSPFTPPSRLAPVVTVRFEIVEAAPEFAIVPELVVTVSAVPA